MIKAVNHILANSGTIQALINLNEANNKTKVYPVVVPGTEKPPFIATIQSGRIREAKFCPDTFQIQVTVYAESYDSATEISAAVITVLEATDAGTINGFDFSYLNNTDELDGPYDEERNLYSKISVFQGK